MKPFILAAADERYWHIYGDAFLNSARAHGHEAEVIRLEMAETLEQKVRCATERFRVLPAYIRSHSAVLCLDVDSIIQAPIEIDPAQYDVGVFIRPDAPDTHEVKIGDAKVNVCAKALAGIFYCNQGGMEFAEAVAEIVNKNDARWGIDQWAIWSMYCLLGSGLRVKLFDENDMSFEAASDAPIYAAKGRSKVSRAFLQEVEHWKHAC